LLRLLPFLLLLRFLSFADDRLRCRQQQHQAA
jgi:hypothetical protein